MAHLGKIEPAARDIGGDHNLDLAFFEAVKDRGPLVLFEAAVDVLQGVYHPFQALEQEFAVALRITEDDGLPGFSSAKYCFSTGSRS